MDKQVKEILERSKKTIEDLNQTILDKFEEKENGEPTQTSNNQ